MSSRPPRVTSGGLAQPATRTPCSTRSTASRRSVVSQPHRAAMRWRRSAAAGAVRAARPPLVTRNWAAGWASASWPTVRRVAASSVAGAFKNLRRAGVLKKRSCTSTLVPTSAGTPSRWATTPPSPPSRRPSGAPPARLVTVKRETAQIAASASPRKPSVAIASRSSSRASLEVAWRSSASGSSSAVMPWPSSETRINAAPPSRRSTVTVRAPASRAFSTSSFTADAGRSTTSPAAILFTSESGSRRILITIRRGGAAATWPGGSAPRSG